MRASGTGHEEDGREAQRDEPAHHGDGHGPLHLDQVFQVVIDGKGRELFLAEQSALGIQQVQDVGGALRVFLQHGIVVTNGGL